MRGDNNQDYRIVQQMIANVDENSVCLDLGCGEGLYLPLLNGRLHKVVGVDINRDSLVNAKGNTKSEVLVVADATSLPFKNDTFNFITSIEVFAHIPSEEGRSNALRELKRVLKSNGKCVISVHNRTRFVLYSLLKLKIRKIETTIDYGIYIVTGLRASDVLKELRNFGFEVHKLTYCNYLPYMVGNYEFYLKHRYICKLLYSLEDILRYIPFIKRSAITFMIEFLKKDK